MWKRMLLASRRHSELRNSASSRGWYSCRDAGTSTAGGRRIKNIFRGPVGAAAGWTFAVIYQARSILFRRLRLFGNLPARPSTSFPQLSLFLFLLPLCLSLCDYTLKYPPSWNISKMWISQTLEIRRVLAHYTCYNNFINDTRRIAMAKRRSFYVTTCITRFYIVNKIIDKIAKLAK